MTARLHTPVSDGLPMPRRLWAILAIALSIGVSVLDATIANVALPSIARDLRISEAASIWVVNAYQIATILFLLPLSSLGDTVGYRRVYLWGIALFGVASVGCAVAHTLPLLIAMRVVQGLGAAALCSINSTLIRLIFPASQLGRGMGINATVVALASVAGPTVAATILSVASWEWLFAINVPISVVAFALSYAFLPENPEGRTARRFNLREALLNALFFGLLFSLVEGLSHGLDAGWLLLLAVIFGAVAVWYLRGQLRARYPLLPFDLMRDRLFSVTVLTSVCSYLGQMSALVALPFYLQLHYGYTELSTGLLLTAWPAVTILLSPLAGWLVERVHAGWLGGLGLTMMAAGAALLGWMPDNPTEWDFVWRMVLCGAGFALFQSPNNSVLIASSPTSRSGAASGVQATARLLGQTTGAALVALLFHLMGEEGPRVAMWLAAIFAALGAVVSFSRLGLPLPEALQPKKWGRSDENPK